MVARRVPSESACGNPNPNLSYLPHPRNPLPSSARRAPANPRLAEMRRSAIVLLMNSTVAAKLHASGAQLDDLCRTCGVERLELFGSACGDAWEPGASDVDLLVRFRAPRRSGIADDYLRLAEGLESLLSCKVDLLTEESVRNPFFRQRVEETREPVYAA